MSAALDFIRNGGETKRYHTWPTLRIQNVGEHSFNVAMLCAWLVGHEAPGIGANLLMAALTHDMAEWKMGDLPAPVKRSMPDVITPFSAGPNPSTTFRAHWGAMEESLLSQHSLDWAHTLTPLEARVLKLADAADGCLYCTRERAMGNKLITPVFINFNAYFAEVLDVTNERELALMAYINREWTDACQ